ncbi:MAG: flagellar FlbD family protein [Lachnospiraceae bacterium]|jgi:flagellar protein FlbD|nr:flagellar FlbD family protein [Lachnospiraceae bacterium]
MIDVTKLDGKEITINAELIEFVDEIPETVITLTTGKKIIVKESRQKIKNLVKSYKRDLFEKFVFDEQID